MDIQSQLDRVVDRWSLLRHPFYQAWSAGQLPVEALRTYAREYGAFIARLPDGWQTLGDAETASEEREHVGLWADFAAGLGTRVSEAALPAVKQLVDTAGRLFADPLSAAGALYAFEVQQPATAQSKLAGLRAFYRLPAGVEPYFEVHSRNAHEAARLLGRIAQLSDTERRRAAHACETMSRALWDALTSIYEAECVKN